jgi:hypothetical protein
MKSRVQKSLLAVLLSCSFWSVNSCNPPEISASLDSNKILWAISSDQKSKIEFEARVPVSHGDCRFVLLHRKIKDDVSDSILIDVANYESNKMPQRKVKLTILNSYSNLGIIKLAVEILGMKISQDVHSNINYGLVTFDSKEIKKINSLRDITSERPSSNAISAVEIEIDDEDIYYILGL